jgi:hypothetical protein
MGPHIDSGDNPSLLTRRRQSFLTHLTVSNDISFAISFAKGSWW